MYLRGARSRTTFEQRCVLSSNALPAEAFSSSLDPPITLTSRRLSANISEGPTTDACTDVLDADTALPVLLDQEQDSHSPFNCCDNFEAY